MQGCCDARLDKCHSGCSACLELRFSQSASRSSAALKSLYRSGSSQSAGSRVVWADVHLRKCCDCAGSLRSRARHHSQASRGLGRLLRSAQSLRRSRTPQLSRRRSRRSSWTSSRACPSCPAQSAPWRPARKTQVLFFGKRVAGCTSGACTLGSHQPEHLAVNRSASAHSADRQFRATDTRYKIPGHHRVRSLCLSDF